LNICWAFSGIPAGIASDKKDRIKLLLFMFLFVGIFSLALLLAHTFFGVFFLLVCLFLTIGIFHPPAYSFLSEGYSENRGRIIGTFETGGSIGTLIAPLVAGFVGSFLGWRYVYTLWALFAFVIAFLFYYLFCNNKNNKIIKNEGHKIKINGKKPPQGKSSSYSPYFRILFLTQGFFGFISGGSISFLPLFLTDMHKFEVSTAGGMLTLFLAGGVVGKLLGGKYSDAGDAKKVVELGFILTAFFLILVPVLPGYLLSIALFPAGITFFMILPAIFFLVGEVKTGDLGLAYGIHLLSGAGFGAISKFLCGVISDAVGIRYIFFLLATVGFFAAFFVYNYLERAPE
ncbi:MFS transporter, partial [Candidatus Aerophobetes bacterium]|nr:MFS transporter [Candidatus Aerophobetes bacterium]